MNKITPVLLAGGTGTRLWPLSRKSYPKQFSTLIGKDSLFQKAVLRLSGSNVLNFQNHITLTNSEYRFIVSEQMQTLGIDPGPILIEPEARNTAPAILAASLYLEKNDPDAILLISPSDHVIDDIENFHHSLSMAFEEAIKGNIVTLGVPPTRAETGYGYIEVLPEKNNNPKRVKKFIEKPNKKLASQMSKSKNFFWNSGMFMFRCKDIIEAFKVHCNDLFDPVEESIKRGKNDLGFFRLDPHSWEQCRNISLDYAVIEKATNLVTIPFFGGWSDLGDWQSVWEQMKFDEKGVALSSNAHSIDCRNTLLRSENSNQELVGVGLENIVAIAMPDAVLISNKNSTQEVKNVVSYLRNKKLSQAEVFPKQHRPWGWFEQLTFGTRFQVKRIFVNPKAALSLQSHHHRSEHWVVVEGTAKVTVGKSIRLIAEGESIHIPLGEKHRLANPGKVPVLLIEVQTGTYLGEDDIIRYDDKYSRS